MPFCVSPDAFRNFYDSWFIQYEAPSFHRGPVCMSPNGDLVVVRLVDEVVREVDDGADEGEVGVGDGSSV